MPLLVPDALHAQLDVQHSISVAAGDASAPGTAAAVADQRDALPGTTSSSSNGDRRRSVHIMRRVASAPAFKHASAYLQEPSAATAVAAAAAEAAAEQAAAAAKAAAPPPAARGGRWLPLRRRAAAGAAAAAASASAAASPPQPAAAADAAPARRPRRASRCACCRGSAACRCLEVYVVSRAFTEFGGPVIRRLPPGARESMVDMGVCHYMTVFRTPEGRLVQFDFGPEGGDVAKAHGPLGALLRHAHGQAQREQQQREQQQDAARGEAGARDQQQQRDGDGDASAQHIPHSPSAPALLPVASLDLSGPREQRAAAAALLQLQDAPGSRPRRGVMGEIRERVLDELPAACMYMGRTAMSLDDIRRYNAARAHLAYSLHENDCRHFVNSLVQYATGVERSTQHLKRHYFVSRHPADQWLWYGWLMSATQLVTDVGNWGHVQAGAAATLLAVTGRSTLAQLRALAQPVVPALAGLPALLGTTTAAAAAATAAAAGGAPAAAAAGAGSAGAGTVMGALATSLKLPAALLLKRPLAAGAAAGGAGAAAAVMRDTAVVTGGSGGAGAGAGGDDMAPGQYRPAFVGAFGSLGRPLRALGDGVAHGLRSAALGVRRLAVGNADALARLQQQQGARAAGDCRTVVEQQPVLAAAGVMAVPAAAGAGGGGGMWWGRRQQNPAPRQHQQQLIAPLAAAGGGGRGGWWGRRGVQQGGSSSSLAAAPTPADAAPTGLVPATRPGAQAVVQEQQQRAAPRGVAGVVGHIGRNVAALGSAAARASGHLAAMAFRGGGAAAPGAPLLAGAPLGGSASSSQLQQAAGGRSLSSCSQRSRSMPSLQLLGATGSSSSAAAASAAAGTVALLPTPVSTAAEASGAPAAPGGRRSATAVTGASGALLLDGGGRRGSVDALLLDTSALVWRDSGVAGGSLMGSGGGRQVLHLPPPRVSWGQRAQAVIVRQ